MLRSDILLDCGVSLNPDIDLGQAQGGFIMGLGYMLTEEFEKDVTSGKNMANGTWEYKPPLTSDIPSEFNVALLKDCPNPSGFMASKASGEPPLLMSVGIVSAIRRAIEAFERTDEKRKGKGDALNAPATPARVFASAGIDPYTDFCVDA